jgi:hypothetical protein
VVHHGDREGQAVQAGDRAGRGCPAGHRSRQRQRRGGRPYPDAAGQAAVRLEVDAQAAGLGGHAAAGGNPPAGRVGEVAGGQCLFGRVRGAQPVDHEPAAGTGCRAGRGDQHAVEAAALPALGYPLLVRPPAGVHLAQLDQRVAQVGQRGHRQLEPRPGAGHEVRPGGVDGEIRAAELDDVEPARAQLLGHLVRRGSAVGPGRHGGQAFRVDGQAGRLAGGLVG